MRETAADIALPGTAELAAAERMSREIAILSGRLAHLLAASQAARDDQIARAHTFLHAMYDAVGDDNAVAQPELVVRKPRSPDTHPIDRLADALALDATEIDLILLAAMAEEHEGYSSVLRSLNPQNEPYATVGLAAQLACKCPRDRAVLHRALETGPVVTAGVITLRGEVPFFERSLMLAEGLWPVLCGFDVFPSTLMPPALNDTAIGLERWLDSPDILNARQMLRHNQPGLLVLTADSETVAAHRAAALARAAERRWTAFEFAANSPPSASQLALVHALARGAAPIFRIASGDSSVQPSMPAIGRHPGTVVICASRGTTVPLDVRRPVMKLDIEPLDSASRERLWSTALPELADHASILAARYMLEPAVVSEVAIDFRAMSDAGGNEDFLEGVAECVRARSNTRLEAGVKLVRPGARWDQLILPRERKAQLTEALQRLTHQGTVLDRWKFLEGRPGARGVRVLLSGPPGTGKTLAAEVVARSLGVDLMIVDISRVVSKWIGETEKHLAEAFDAAERCQAVLLFDEADALFGKRTEVSDAHDRYANLETAYLLSRLERFDGMAILSTNLKQNIDPAFLRRLEFVIDFDEPSAIEREALWRCHLPPGAPLADDVDLKELAALYPIVGGLIRNASVAAAFLAASANSAITRNHLVGAVRREYEKSAKSFPGLPAGALRT
jgi:ATPase family protein associated with various cellular activities (AAA)/winged helix domain-containing protein